MKNLVVMISLGILPFVSCSKSKSSVEGVWQIDIKSGKSIKRRPGLALSSTEIVSKEITDKHIVMVLSSSYKDGIDSNTDVITVSIMEKSGQDLKPIITRYFEGNEKMENDMLSNKSHIIEIESNSLKVSFGDNLMLVRLPNR